MNKLFMIIGAVCLFTLTALVNDIFVGAPYSKNNDDAMLAWNYKYCASMQDGKLVVMQEGKVLTANATLANGTMITKDGYVVTKDGTRTMLHNGDCVDKDGTIVAPKDQKMKKE